MDVNRYVKDLPRGLISWYNFKKDTKALLITGKFPAFKVLFSVFEDVGIKAESVDISEIGTVDGGYDYIIVAAGLESTLEPKGLLAQIRKLLKGDGILFLATFNRLNIGQVVGDKDVTTGHVLDGLDNYKRIVPHRMKEMDGRCYTKLEIEEMLTTVGLETVTTFSLFPNLFRPQIMVKYGETPNERFDGRLQGIYNAPESVFLDKASIYDDFMKHGLLHTMADGYLFVCRQMDSGDAISKEITDIKSIQEITVQTGRKPEAAQATIVYTDKVVKKNMYPEGLKSLEETDENARYLNDRGVPIITGNFTENGYETPFIKGQILTDYLRDTLIKNGQNDFIATLTTIKNIIEHSSNNLSYDEVDWTKFDPYWEKRKPDDPELYKWRDLAHGTEEDKAAIGVILERGYLDLAPINCFMTETGPLYFDQEFYIRQFPANAIFLRTIEVVYAGWNEGEKLMPLQQVLDHFNLSTHAEMFRLQIRKHLLDFINDNELQAYYGKVQPHHGTLTNNRFRMDYPQAEYEKLFTDIFKDADGKKLYIFGSGDYATKFVKRFRDQYEIAGIIDNNSEKWGKDLEGIRIYEPAHLLTEKTGLKVFICIKFYDEVLTQLKEMGITHIGIFNPWLTYPKPPKHIPTATADAPPKKYHIGYVAGVFDMFHVGHLNLLRRAKEQCDYLIVGIVTDEQILKYKKTRPVIPFIQRFAIVQGCRYVDEAVTIPIEDAGSEYAYNTYQFDVQFSGSDYENDPNWLATKEYLRQRGSDLIFFPYTEEVSSTMLKEQLRENTETAKNIENTD